MYVCTLLFAIVAPAAAGNINNLDRLVEAAGRLKLAADPQWLALLHYQHSLWSSRPQSQVDDRDFFLASSGMVDPEAELQETLSRLLSEPAARTDRSYQCRFPARWEWLSDRLPLLKQSVRSKHCPQLRRWLTKLDPTSLGLVYASSFMNNPASLFGHTLLLVSSHRPEPTKSLLDFAINYAAHTQGERGVLFAIKGLTGGYRGRFTTTEFDAMVREYGDSENRDLWEYRLNFNSKEIRRLLLHIWELRDADFDYFFLDENCAYHLLALLDVARPSLELAAKFKWWVVPTDTIRAVTAVPDLVKSVHLRPATSTILQERMRRASATVRAGAQILALGSEDELSAHVSSMLEQSTAQQADSLDLALNYLDYAAARKTDPQHEKRRYRLLKLRNALALTPAAKELEHTALPPDRGHATTRSDYGIGTYAGRFALGFNYRPAYHDLMDPQDGYAQGMQLQFLNTHLRFYPDRQTIELERLDLIDLLSLSPRQGWIRPLSWQAALTVKRRSINLNQRPTVFEGSTGIGLASNLGNSLAYALINMQLQAGALRGQPFDVGWGLRCGWLWDATVHWRMGLEVSHGHFFLTEPATSQSVDFSQRVKLSDAISLRLHIGWLQSAVNNDLNAAFSLSYYH